MVTKVDIAHKKLESRNSITSLIGDYMQLVHEHEANSDDVAYTDTLEAVQGQIKKKIEDIDVFSLEVKRKEFFIDAEIEALAEEIQRLKSRKRAIGRFKQFMENMILPWAIKKFGNGKVWETSYARYTMYEAYGELDVHVPLEKVPDDYKKVEIKEGVNRSLARKDSMAAQKDGKDGLSWCRVKKITKVRRS
jgi:hypothetical protein|tara:strand:+ start:93 stop:668 length:576 start_codon:yes stop_codon:yes gene_type:complete